MLFEMHSFFQLFSSPLWKYLSCSFDLDGMRFIYLCLSAFTVIICSGELLDIEGTQEACRWRASLQGLIQMVQLCSIVK